MSKSPLFTVFCNQCLLPLTLWVRIPLRRGVLDTTLCDKACHWLATGRWFSLDTPVSSTNKTDRYDITESDVKHHKPNPSLHYLHNILYLFYASTISTTSQLATITHWPCNCTVHVLVIIHFYDSMWSCWEEVDVCRVCFIAWLYIHCRWRSSFQEELASH